MTDEKLYQLAEQVGSALKVRGMMMASAESCTGGWIAQAVTAVPGSSEWFERGFVTYTYISKREMLGVKAETLETCGAVSLETVHEMTVGALARSHAQVAVSVSGTAGPTGGTAQKPVGTVCFGWGANNAGGGVQTAAMHFDGDREAVRRQAVAFALERVLAVVGGETRAEAPALSVQRLDAEATRTESPCGDGSMVWRSWGKGEGKPALVLLHGGAGSWQHWMRTVPAFSGAYRVLAPDLPGLGESANPPAEADMATIAAIVAAGIDGLLGAQASYDLVGFSFGASVGGHVALLHGARVRSLTLLGAGGLIRPRTPMTLERVRDKTGDALMEAHRTNLARTMVADPACIDALALEIQTWNARHSRLDSPALISLRPLAVSLPQLRIPVNAIWGERDQIAYYTVADRIAALRVLRPGIEPHIISSAGHWAAYEAPDAFNAALAGFLRCAPAGGTPVD